MCERDGFENRPRPILAEASVTANQVIAEGVGLVSLHVPAVAQKVCPGQFVHLRIATGRDYILRRPFSVYGVSGGDIEILYQVVGRGTRELIAAKPGDTMDVVGPLGRGWRISDDSREALLVAGGLGVAPLRLLAEALSSKGVSVSLALGAPTDRRLVGLGPFEAMSCTIFCCTDDGSAGTKGLVTLASAKLIEAKDFDIVYTCGPEVMQCAVAAQAVEVGIPCQVSLERLMACGIGACLSCTVETTAGRMRACVDGPVFDASEIVWEKK